jgi:hypothetical protein
MKIQKTICLLAACEYNSGGKVETGGFGKSERG